MCASLHPGTELPSGILGGPGYETPVALRHACRCRRLVDRAARMRIKRPGVVAAQPASQHFGRGAEARRRSTEAEAARGGAQHFGFVSACSCDLGVLRRRLHDEHEVRRPPLGRMLLVCRRVRLHRVPKHRPRQHPLQELQSVHGNRAQQRLEIR